MNKSQYRKYVPLYCFLILLSFLSFVAGLFLLRKSLKARHLSVLVQLVQIPVFAWEGLLYKAYVPAQLAIGKDPAGDIQLLWGLGVHVSFSLENTLPGTTAINFLAALMLLCATTAWTD